MMKRLIEAVSNSLIEREQQAHAIVLGLVARVHVLLIGPPGTAKSMIAAHTAAAIDGARYFRRLLTKYTVPDELFGPVRPSAFKQDKYERAIDGTLVTAHLALLDEIWKAGAILNTLLTIMEERIFDNHDQVVQSPLISCIGASNEYPDPEEGATLGALFDRFTIRQEILPVSKGGRELLLTTKFTPPNPVVTLSDLHAAAAQAQGTPVSDDAVEAFFQMLDTLAAEGIIIGDRRCVRAMQVAKAEAVINGHSKVETTDLEVLKDVLWTSPEHRTLAMGIVTKIANPVGAAIDALMAEVGGIMESCDSNKVEDRMSAISKLEDCESRAAKLLDTGNGRADKLVNYIRRQRVALQAKAFGLGEDAQKRLLEALK